MLFRSLAQLQQNGDGEDGAQNEYGNSGVPSKPGAPDGGFDGAGRPPKTGTYGTDDNPFGRDPLGNKSNRRAAKPATTYDKTKLSPLAYEQAEALSNSLSKMKKKTKKVILESLKDDDQHDDGGGLLDEKNLIDDTI